MTAVPSKLFEYMAAGRPIVYAGEGAAVALIDETGSGITTAPGDVRAIVDAIRAAATPAGVRWARKAEPMSASFRRAGTRCAVSQVS